MLDFTGIEGDIVDREDDSAAREDDFAREDDVAGL